MSTATPTSSTTRLLSLDAFRGFVMLAMASGGFRCAEVAKNAQFQDSDIWKFLGYQCDHVPWVGWALWDLIQPSFMFMVGVSMAYSYAKRQSKGQTYGHMLLHAMVRSLVLVLLGIALMSNFKPRTDFEFVNVLIQIGLGYTFLF